MDRKQITISALLTIASAVVSCGFVAYGAGIMLMEDVEAWFIIMGIAKAVYGFVSLVVLFMAWRDDRKNWRKVIFYFATGFLLLYILGSLDSGMISGLEYGFLFGVAVLLAINWVAVRVVMRNRGVT